MFFCSVNVDKDKCLSNLFARCFKELQGHERGFFFYGNKNRVMVHFSKNEIDNFITFGIRVTTIEFERCNKCEDQICGSDE